MIGLFIGAIYMILADKYSEKVQHPQTVDQINYFQAFVIGISQAIAMWPGFSRSGSTISTGVFMKLNHKAASDFTFIMSVPIMLAASGLSLLKHYEYIHLAHVPFYLLGFLAAFIVGLIAIKTFLHLINKVKLIPFAIYRIVLVVILQSFTLVLALAKEFKATLGFLILSVAYAMDFVHCNLCSLGFSILSVYYAMDSAHCNPLFTWIFNP